MIRRHQTSRAYTLLEIMVVVGLLAVALVGVLRFFGTASAKASVQEEKTNLSSLVQSIDGQYASKSSFATVSVADLTQHQLSGVRLDSSGTKILSAFGSTIDVKPATVSVANDAYQIVYSNMSSPECAGLVPAVAGGPYAISIAGAPSVVSTASATLGQVTNPEVVAQQCAGTTFANHAGTVTLTYYRSGNAAAGLPPGGGCVVSCAPQTQSQSIACPVGQTGQVNQTRSGTCSAAACPVLVWSGWTTVSSSCAAAPPGPPPPVVLPPPPPPPPVCVVTTATRDQPCAAGFAGVITQKQTSSCPSGIMGPWTTVSNTCVAQPVVACTSGSNTQTLACPPGEGGSIVQMQNYSCDANGNHVPDGPWTTVSNDCTTSCAPLGTCCSPSTAPDGTNAVPCAAGQYGQIIQTLEKSSTCATPTSLPAWGPGVVVSSAGSCAACPAAVTNTQNQTIPGSAACPAGQSGSDTWTQQQTRTNTVTYNCPAGTTVLPAPVTSPWTAWVNTGGKIGEVNTCAPTATPCTPTFGSCQVVSPNGPDTSTVIYTLSNNHIEQTAFDASITLTAQQQAQTTPMGNCPDTVLMYWTGSWVGANALVAGYPSSDYMSGWVTYPDPSYPAGPNWSTTCTPPEFSTGSCSSSAGAFDTTPATGVGSMSGSSWSCMATRTDTTGWTGGVASATVPVYCGGASANVSGSCSSPSTTCTSTTTQAVGTCSCTIKVNGALGSVVFHVDSTVTCTP